MRFMRIALYELNKHIMKSHNLKTFLSYALAAAVVLSPAAAFAKEGSNAKSNGKAAKVEARASLKQNGNKHEVRAKGNATTTTSCPKAFGHLIAPGWIKHNGTITVGEHCKLPAGISFKLGGDRPGTSTPPATTTDTTAPSIFLVRTATGSTTATVTWYTNERADTQLAYGTTTSYGNTTTRDANLSRFHSVTITGLVPATEYHFQVLSRDAAGNLATSSDRTFATKSAPDTVAPVIGSVSVSGVSSTSAAVSWTTNEPSTSKVYYTSGTSLNLGSASTSANTALQTTHSINLAGLTASTTYLFAVQSSDASGNTTTSATGSFLTSN